jgi:hypothetical protein
MVVGGQHDAPAAFTLRIDAVPIVQEARWASERVWIGAENFAPTGIRFPDLSARGESLYRLRHPGSYIYIYSSSKVGVPCDMNNYFRGSFAEKKFEKHKFRGV